MRINFQIFSIALIVLIFSHCQTKPAKKVENTPANILEDSCQCFSDYESLHSFLGTHLVLGDSILESTCAWISIASLIDSTGNQYEETKKECVGTEINKFYLTTETKFYYRDKEDTPLPNAEAKNNLARLAQENPDQVFRIELDTLNKKVTNISLFFY